MDIDEFVEEYQSFNIWEQTDASSENAIERVIREFQTVSQSLQTNRKDAFITGSFYFGEWIMDKTTHKWIPDGRGIIVHLQKNLIYIGNIVQQKLTGLGIQFPFEKNYNCPKGHQLEKEDVNTPTEEKKFKIC